MDNSKSDVVSNSVGLDMTSVFMATLIMMFYGMLIFVCAALGVFFILLTTVGERDVKLNAYLIIVGGLFFVAAIGLAIIPFVLL